jgi:hypothetical protein
VVRVPESGPQPASLVHWQAEQLVTITYDGDENADADTAVLALVIA